MSVYKLHLKKIQNITWNTILILLLFSVNLNLIGCSNNNEPVITPPSKPNEDYKIPDKDGMTIKGIVSCNGMPISNVMVSDGVEVTTTDKDGIYYLPSKKKNNYVFISVPEGYEIESKNNFPQFFARLNGENKIEQKNFSLQHCDNDDYVLMTFADIHLANRNNDVAQFTSGFLKDANKLIAEYKSKGKKVYGLTLGDLSWDAYWYSNKFALTEAMNYISKIDCPTFNCMGNHDNDPYSISDWSAEQKYKDIVGPSYYSFNLGKVHYVVLDDIEYINNGGGFNTIGECNYKSEITLEQLTWLAKDLALLKDKNQPIVIAMHIPLHSNPYLDADGNIVNKISLANGKDLLSCISNFNNVTIVSGHTHINYCGYQNEGKVKEFNTAAVCATWWWTGKNGYADNHICKDGSPGGYGVWEIKDTKLSHYYKSIGFNRDYQFRTYDLNNVYITAEKFAPKSTDELLNNYNFDYSVPNNNNEVLINVWGFADGWSIEVTENNKKLEVTRIPAYDPLHIISYEAKRLNYGSTPTSSFLTLKTRHMFKVQASSPTSTLSIKVKDSYGNLYKEDMQRPKEFSTSIK